MKIQHTRTGRSKLSVLAVVLAMLAMLACAFTVVVSANTTFSGIPTAVTVEIDDLDIALTKDTQGIYYKVYDGTTDVAVTLNKTNEQLGIAAGDDVKVEATASFASKDVVVLDKDGKVKTNYINITLSLSGADASKYTLTQSEFSVGAEIRPKTLTWDSDTVNLTTTYQPDSVEYLVKFDLLSKLTGVVKGDEGAVPEGIVSFQADKGNGAVYTIQYPVSLGSNYIVEDLTVKVTVNPIEIVSIEWAEEYVFPYGSAAANAIDIFGLDKDGNKYLLHVVYPNGYAQTIGDFQIRVEEMSDGFKFSSAITETIKTVTIEKAEYQVSMNPAVYIGNPDTAENPTTYMLTVIGDLPQAVRDQIVYRVDGKPFAGTNLYGSYTVVATLPSDVGYSFVDANGKAVTELTATLTINKSAVFAGGIEEEEYAVTVVGADKNVGVPATLEAIASIPKLERKAIRKFPNYKAYEVTISGSQGSSYKVEIAIHNDLINNGVLPTADDLYLYDPVQGTMVKATEKGLKVILEEGRYEVSGLSGDGEWIFVIAPVHVTSFWLTAPGIAIIILLILALLALLFFVGMMQRRARAAAALAAEEEDEDDTTILEDAADEIAEELAETVEPEAEPEGEADPDAVDGAAEEVIDEVAEEIREEIAAEENTVAEDMADQAAEALAEEVAAEEENVQADEQEVDDAVAALMAETVENLPESEDDDEDDDDDAVATFGGFNMSGLEFIDVKEDPEAYAALLEREKNGEIQLVYRYRRSYQSRLAQSQGKVQDYYTILKNALLSYKGVKGRISWNYEAFNKGRTHLAKMNAKTKTLYLYLALDPAELADSKYGIVDVSSKKKYASVPVLMKIKGDRKFKYALELIEKMCAEQQQLPKRANAEDIDYRVPYQSTEDLVEAGIVKKLAAGVPMEDTAVAASEDITTEEAPTQEV